jgi:hypoxanthine phosphoribosyltransferase
LNLFLQVDKKQKFQYLFLEKLTVDIGITARARLCFTSKTSFALQGLFLNGNREYHYRLLNDIENVLEKEILIPREKIRKRVKDLAERIGSDYEGKEPVLIGVLNGVIFFIADLAREMTIPVKMDFIRAASYGSGMTSSGTVKLTKGVEIPIQGKPVILVEDIVDTGLTLTHIIKKIGRTGPESIRICALIDKTERRDLDVSIDYCGFKIEEGFLVGYGLDHDEQYRHLPDIYILR